MQETLRSLRAVHYATQMAIDKGMPEDEIVNAHPVVRTHPETGRRLLFVNGNYTKHFEGWTERESAPLLEFLYGEIGRFEYTYRHRWHPGDLLVWDNRAAQHAVLRDELRYLQQRLALRQARTGLRGHRLQRRNRRSQGQSPEWPQARAACAQRRSIYRHDTLA